MKLHLPQSLRKALIACMAAFSGVVSTVSTGTVLVGSACLLAWNHAQAEVITLGNDEDPQLTSAVAGDKLIIDFTGELEYAWNGTKTVNADVQIKRLYLSGSDAGCTYIFNGVITGDGPFQTLGGLYCDDVRFTFNNDMSGYSGNIVINESNNCILTFNLKSGATTGTGSITALNADSVVNINGAHVANSSINAATIIITKDSGYYNPTFASGMSLSATKAINNSAEIKLDNITLGHSIHNTGSITFSGKTTLQGIAGENKTPTTNGFVSTVYQFVTGTGTVAKADGASFMLGTEDVTQYYANGAIAVPTGTIYAIVEAGSTVSSSSVANETGYIITGSNATLVLNDLNAIAALPHGIEVDTGDGNAATVQLGQKGTGVNVVLNDTDITRTTGTVNVSVQEYCALNLTQTTNARVINGNITVAAGGTVYATAQDVLGYGGGQIQNIYLLGEPDSTAKLYFADRATLQTNLVMQGNVLVGSTATMGVGVPGSVDTYGGAISATGTNNKFEADILERKAFAVEVTNAADTLDISGRISRSGDATSTELGGITKTGLGTLTLSHADNSFFGTFAIDEGKVVLEGNAEFAKNIRVAKDASLVVKDGVLLSFSSVDNLSMHGGESYVDIHGNVAENGYRSGLFAVVEAEAGAAISGITQVEVQGVRKNVTTDAATGSLLIADTDNSIYHINTTVDYDADSMGAINAYSVAPGATFNTTSGDLLYKVTLEDATSNLYYTNAAGDKLLQFSGEQGDTGLALSVADAKNADGLWVVTTSTPENNAYTGHITVLTGAVLQNGPNNDGLGKNYRDNTDRLITVQGGAALNLAGKEFYYHLVLEKGATLYNTGGALAGNVCSLPVIDLLGDATVRADAMFGMVGYYYAETGLNLNGHTLTKTGADTFHLLNVVANAGTINVQEGTFAWLTNNVNTNNLEAVKIQLGNGATLKHNAGEKSIASLYINTTQGSASGGTVEVVNSSLTVSGSVIADELLTKTGGGTLKLNGLTILAKGVTVTGGTLELNNTVTLNGGVITVGGGTLSVGTSGCVELGFLGGLDNTPAEVPTENKLVATEGTYKVLDKAATATVTNFSTVRYAGKDYKLDATGSVSLGRNVYYAVEKDSVVTVGGTTPTNDTDKATEFYVADGATLQVDGDASEDMPVKQVLLSSAGDGLLKLNADATLSDGDALSFTGTLAVQSGKTLTFGTGGDNTKRFDIDTSSLKRMELNGGTTQIYYTALNLAELKVTGENSKWFVDDINEGSPASVINKLTLDKNLNIETNWKSNLYIGTLTGSGHLTIKQTNDQERLMSPLVIGGFEQYTGKITVSSEENGKVDLTLNVDNGQSLRASQVEVAHANASASITGSGAYDLGSAFSLGERITLADAWEGTVLVTGASIGATDVADATGLTTANSTLEIAGLTLAKGGQLTLGANTVLGGAVALADSIIAADSGITLLAAARTSAALTLDLTGMSGTPTADGKYIFTVFSGEAVDLSGLSVANLSAATKGMAAADTDWSFNSDGTITLAAMVQYRNDSGTWDDNLWENKDGSVQAELKPQSTVVFNATGTDTVTLTAASAAQIAVHGMMVQSGTYNFGGVYGGSATLNVAGTLSTLAGTDSAFDMSVTAGSWENAGKVTANYGFHVTGDASVTGGSVTASNFGIKVDGNYTQTGGDVRTSSLIVGGTTTISGGSIGSAGSTPLALKGVFIGGAAVDNVALTDSTITGQLDTTGALQVGGKMTVNKAGFTQGVDLWDATTYSDEDGISGYATAAYEVQLVKTPGNVSALPDGVTWQDNSGVQATYDAASGKLIVKADTEGTLYYVNVNGDIIYDKDEAQFDKATGIVMNGGKLHLRTPLSDLIANNAGIRVECPEKNNLLGILANAVLNEEDLTVSGTAGVKLSGDGEYVLDAADLELGTGVSLAQDWSGTVSAPRQNLGSTADLTVGQHLFNQNQVDPHNSTVKIAGITARNLTALPGRHGLMLVEGDMALSGAASSVNGDLEVTGTATLAGAGAALNVGEDMDVQALVLGNTQEKAVLTVTGTLNARSITLAHADSAITAGELGLPVNLLMTPEVLNSIGVKASQAPVTMVELTGDTASATMVSVNGKDISGGIGEPGSKYFFTIAWNAKLLQAVGTRNPNYVVEKLEPTDSNAAAGATLLSDAFAASDPQINAPDSDLAAILNAVDAGLVTNEQAAAVAGSSTTALGMAFAGDVERQLRAIRNRTTTMGVDPCVFHEEMPYFNAWINAEGNMAELDQDGNMPGYTLDSWGGTVGFDVDVNPSLTLGMAVTAMYGDLTTDGPDTLEGDMDTYYVSAFARYSKRGWSHTFVATVGKMDTTYERTVSYAGGSYMAEGDTDGTAFGVMYELARSYTLDYEGNVGGQLVANVAYRHTTVGGYEETGRDAALKVDDQTLDTITFGVGGRMQAVVGENLFNRTSVFEARALAKFDVGDRSSEADVAFLGGSRSATVESAELGAFGVELGAGFSIPVGNVNDGTIFFDVSAELRSGYTNVNGTVGYRINF